MAFDDSALEAGYPPPMEVEFPVSLAAPSVATDADYSFVPIAAAEIDEWS